MFHGHNQGPPFLLLVHMYLTPLKACTHKPPGRRRRRLHKQSENPKALLLPTSKGEKGHIHNI